jgi:hypothetical protein
MPRPEFPEITRRLIAPHRAIGNFIWQIALISYWTHYFMPDGHARGCPDSYKPLETCLCPGGVDLRTKQMCPEGRFYLKFNLTIWRFGLRWYYFWLYKYYGWLDTYLVIERLLTPSVWAEEDL